MARLIALALREKALHLVEAVGDRLARRLPEGAPAVVGFDLGPFEAPGEGVVSSHATGGSNMR